MQSSNENLGTETNVSVVTVTIHLDKIIFCNFYLQVSLEY